MLKGLKANIDDLRIFGFKCHATFAGEKGELIVLLDEVWFLWNDTTGYFDWASVA